MLSKYGDVIFEENVKKTLDFKAKDVSSVLGLNHNVLLSEQCVRHYEIDLEIYGDIFKDSREMRILLEEGINYLPVFDRLYKDIFFCLYKYSPVIYKECNVRASSKINNQIIRKIVKLREFKKLRKSCCLDVFNSAIGCEVLGKKAIEILKKMSHKNDADEEEKDDEKTQQEEEDTKRDTLGGIGGIDKGSRNINQDNIPDLINELKQLEEDVDSLSREETDDYIKQSIEESGYSRENLNQEEMKQLYLTLEEAKKRLEEKERDFEGKLREEQDYIEDFSQDMVEAFNEADMQVRELSECIESWGMSENSRKPFRIPFDVKRDAVEKIRQSKKLKELSKIIGRFKETALEDEKKKSKDGALSINSVKIGNEIIRTLPSEKMLLLNPITKREFYRKYSEKELLQYELQSNKVKIKGPMVVCIDMSSSMRGSREKWSKAVAIALLEIAQIQKRDFAAILFNEKALDPIIIEKDEVDPNKILDIAERFDGGSTEFEEVLEKALTVIENSVFNKADIVFITDGHCIVGDDFLRKFNKIKRQKQFKVISVCIDAGSKKGNIKTLRPFSDEILLLSELAELENANSNIVHKIFQRV